MKVSFHSKFFIVKFLIIFSCILAPHLISGKAALKSKKNAEKVNLIEKQPVIESTRVTEKEIIDDSKESLKFLRFLIMFNDFMDEKILSSHIDHLIQKGYLTRDMNGNSTIPKLARQYSGPIYGISIEVARSSELEKFSNLNLVKYPHLKSTRVLPNDLLFLNGLLPFINYVELDSLIEVASTFFSQSSSDAIDFPQLKMVSYGYETSSVRGMSNFKIQHDAPWHLVRISNKKALKFQNEYNYYYDENHQGQNVNVYVVDSGLYEDHVEFEGRAKMLRDFTGQGLMDEAGHGTHVAGIIGGRRCGVAKKVTLFGVKAIKKNGNSDWSTIVDALNWIYHHSLTTKKRSIVNMSMEGKHSEIANAAIKMLSSAGIPVIASAGNLGADACLSSPGSCSDAIIVGATDNKDLLNSFPPSNFGKCVNILAPGYSIESASIFSPNTLVGMSGTSMAAPMVTGVLATLFSAHRHTPNKEIIDRIMEMATVGAIKNLVDETPNRLLFSL